MAYTCVCVYFLPKLYQSFKVSKIPGPLITTNNKTKQYKISSCRKDTAKLS